MARAGQPQWVARGGVGGGRSVVGGGGGRGFEEDVFKRSLQGSLGYRNRFYASVFYGTPGHHHVLLEMKINSKLNCTFTVLLYLTIFFFTHSYLEGVS